MPWQSCKTYDIGLSCCFRQWRADSHCRFIHGYDLIVTLCFEATYLDVRNWVVDFGGLKQFKEWLCSMFDHKLVVALDDPLLEHFERLEELGAVELTRVPDVGCEKFAEFIYRACEDWLTRQKADGRENPQARMKYVEVKEHGANSARFYVLEAQRNA